MFRIKTTFKNRNDVLYWGIPTLYITHALVIFLTAFRLFDVDSFTESVPYVMIILLSINSIFLTKSLAIMEKQSIARGWD